ncbi:MAG: cytochrome c biogenesis protein [Desulfobacteraceae bacterium]|nr:cytochrome c biogenesis protein [Desulfobacteraceae bacterium]
MENTLILSVATFIYGFSALCFVIESVFNKKKFGSLGFFLLVAGLSTNFAGFLFRWIESYQMGIGRIPLSNLYESLVFFSISGALIYSVIYKKFDNPVIGAITTTIVFLAMAYAGLSPSADSAITPLIPALRSNWLTVHVITCFFGYAGFAVSFAASILIIFTRDDNKWKNLDELNYKMIIFGFLFLSLGIITGAVWADSAWGRYWSWDPKETWSLITWFVYAIVLHARYMKNFTRKTIAWLSIVGFIAVLFTYFGVNFVLAGLHSYA